MAKRKKDEDIVVDHKSAILDAEEIKNEIEEELKIYFKDYSEKRFLEEIEKSNRRLIKEKNRQIIFRDIIIFLFLAGMIFSIYVLYRKNILSQFIHFNRNTQVVIPQDNSTNNNSIKEENKEPTQEELQKKYGYLLDNYHLGEKSRYLGSFYAGELTSEIKKEMVINYLTSKEIINEDDYSYIDEGVFKKKFSELFDSGYNQESFLYDGNKIRFINKYGQYISDKIIEKDTFIEKKIEKVEEEKQNVLITTFETINDVKHEITYVFQNQKLINLKTS